MRGASTRLALRRRTSKQAQLPNTGLSDAQHPAGQPRYLPVKGSAPRWWAPSAGRQASKSQATQRRVPNRRRGTRAVRSPRPCAQVPASSSVLGGVALPAASHLRTSHLAPRTPPHRPLPLCQNLCHRRSPPCPSRLRLRSTSFSASSHPFPHFFFSPARPTTSLLPSTPSSLSLPLLGELRIYPARSLRRSTPPSAPPFACRPLPSEVAEHVAEHALSTNTCPLSRHPPARRTDAQNQTAQPRTPPPQRPIPSPSVLFSAPRPRRFSCTTSRNPTHSIPQRPLLFMYQHDRLNVYSHPLKLQLFRIPRKPCRPDISSDG